MPPILTSRPWKIVGAVLAAIVLLVIGYAAGLLTPQLRAPGESSADAGFARDMSEHHAQAVELGMIAYQNAALPDVRSLGGDIALTQQGQIAVMHTLLTSWGLGPNSSQRPMAWMPDGERALTGNLMPGMATREEVQGLRSATGKDVDILFCQYLLRHHLGGIHMVNGLLEQSPEAELRELAETMKRNQSGEIIVLEGLLTTLGSAPLR